MELIQVKPKETNVRVQMDVRFYRKRRVETDRTLKIVVVTDCDGVGRYTYSEIWNMGLCR